MTDTLMRIAGLTLTLGTDRGTLTVLRDITLDLPRGRILGIVGESGSGKSTLALAMLGMLPRNTLAHAGQVWFDDADLLAMRQATLQGLRGNRIAMVFQDPMAALNPVFSIGHHLDLVQRIHAPERDRRTRSAEAVRLLRSVGIADAAGRLDAYPHQFSGGMRQRILIAMALAMNPALLVADEPTTALDATVERQIVALFSDLRASFAGTVVLISHSLGLVAELCDEVAVMYAGRVVEHGPTGTVFSAPAHPYTAALLACERSTTTGRLPSIGGMLPDLVHMPPGCAFAPRCGMVTPQCAIVPALLPVPGATSHQAACWHMAP